MKQILENSALKTLPHDQMPRRVAEGWRFVACSIKPFSEKACPSDSVPIMIRCSSSTLGRLDSHALNALHEGRTVNA